MKIERKITFVVAGIEFDNLKTARFFQRAIRLHKLENEKPESCAAFLIDHWNGLIFGGKNPIWFTTQQVVELVQNLQMPKAHVQKKKVTTLSEVLELKKNVQVLAGDVEKTFDDVNRETAEQHRQPMLNAKGEFNFDTIPGVYGKDDLIG